MDPAVDRLGLAEAREAGQECRVRKFRRAEFSGIAFRRRTGTVHYRITLVVAGARPREAPSGLGQARVPVRFVRIGIHEVEVVDDLVVEERGSRLERAELSAIARGVDVDGSGETGVRIDVDAPAVSARLGSGGD